MSIGETTTRVQPKYLEGRVPTTDQIFRALGEQSYTYDVNKEFVRAIDNVDYVASASPYKSHRFGPPPEFVSVEGRLEFTWLYVAQDDLVASWESQLVKNNRGAGNGFHITRNATERGLLARIRFKEELRLWNLGSDHSSRLGMQDIVSSEDHEACQWFGCRLREAMMRLPHDLRPDGFVYPSRRVGGSPALAFADWAVGKLFATAEIQTERFVGSRIHRYFFEDPMRTDPPDLDASRHQD